MHPRSFLLAGLLSLPMQLAASPGQQPEMWVGFSSERSEANHHGHADFDVISLRVSRPLLRLPRIFDRWDQALSVSYGDVRQPRSWFGYRDGDPNDRIRSEWATFLIRARWRRSSAIQPFVEIGTGPMWSNRRIPAATSRLNVNSQFACGLIHRRIEAGYRFSHVSNGGTASRNPGWNVHGLFVGARIR